MIGKWFNLFDKYDKYYINPYSKSKIKVVKPINYDENVDIEISDEYDKFSISQNYNFFCDIIEGKIDITTIDDIDLSIQGRNYKKCNYCKVISTYFPMRLCSSCDKLMCSLCWEEKTEEDAKLNGSKNYVRRKDDLQKCFSHIEKINIKYNTTVYCDLCKNFSRDIYGTWYCDRKGNKDICPQCSISEAGYEIINLFGSFIPTKYKDELSELPYGSLLDWIIIGKHKSSDDLLLININRDSKLYGKYASIIYDNDEYKMNTSIIVE